MSWIYAAGLFCSLQILMMALPLSQWMLGFPQNIRSQALRNVSKYKWKWRDACFYTTLSYNNNIFFDHFVYRQQSIYMAPFKGDADNNIKRTHTDC